MFARAAVSRALGGLRQRPWVLLALAALLLFSRRPEALLAPQFWAEEGARWYADAWEDHGLAPFLRTEAGYFQTFPRLLALLAVQLPCALGPAVLHWGALLVMLLPPAVLLSRRARTVAPWSARLLLAGLYIGLPNSHELHVDATDSQWHLALASMLLLVSAAPRSGVGRAGDAVVHALVATTGPFALLLAPMAALTWWRGHRARVRVLPFAVLALGAVVQACGLATSHDARAVLAHPVTAGAVARILAHQVFLPPWLGRRTLSHTALGDGAPFALACAVAVAGLLLLVAAARAGGWRLASFAAVAAALVAATLAFPGAPATGWPEVLVDEGGLRYWFFPQLAVQASVVALACGSGACWCRRVAQVAVLGFAVGIAVDWRHPRLPDLDFGHWAARAEALEPGERLVIPLHPEGWSMQLSRRPRQ